MIFQKENEIGNTEFKKKIGKEKEIQYTQKKKEKNICMYVN